jgi:hypothetical protein
MKRWYRIEVAAAVQRRGRASFHATGLTEDMENRVPLGKVSEELSFLEGQGLLERQSTDSRNNDFVANSSVYWDMAAALERELLP